MSSLEQAADLREVRGPSALGGGRRRFFDLLWLMGVTEFKRTYFGTVLGYLWSLVRPLMLFAVLLFVFTKIVRIGSDTPNYPVLLLLGIVLFSFFQEATQNSVTSVVAQEGIVRKTQFPRLVIPLATVLTAFFNLLLNLIVVFVFVLAWGVDPSWTWLLFPFSLGLIAVLTAAVSMMLSVLYVRFRDVAIIWTVLGQVLFYMTPVLYPLTVLENQTLQRLMLVNPLAPIFNEIQRWVINPDEPSSASIAGSAVYLIPAAVLFVAICAFGVWIFNRDAPKIAEEL
ncbi:MAG TPA: ABC transporter permease [Solirubrobacterales bacterium]|nr:ABC transporter permease [Solirubrobacterales bacterium]